MVERLGLTLSKLGVCHCALLLPSSPATHCEMEISIAISDASGTGGSLAWLLS